MIGPGREVTHEYYIIPLMFISQLSELFRNPRPSAYPFCAGLVKASRSRQLIISPLQNDQNYDWNQMRALQISPAA